MQYRRVSFYVEWKGGADTDAVRAILYRHGIRIVDTDHETDLKHTPGLLSRHENTIFRFRTDRKDAAVGLLTEIAMHPSVYSVSEI